MLGAAAFNTLCVNVGRLIKQTGLGPAILSNLGKGFKFGKTFL